MLSNIFIENNDIFQNKRQQQEEWHHFILKISLMLASVEDTWIVIAASTFNLLCYHTLGSF